MTDLIDREALRAAMVRERDALTNGLTQIAMADGLDVALFLLEKAAPAAEPVPLTLDALVARAAQAYVDWQYRMPGAPRFTLSDLRAALASPDKGEPR